MRTGDQVEIRIDDFPVDGEVLNSFFFLIKVRYSIIYPGKIKSYERWLPRWKVYVDLT